MVYSEGFESGFDPRWSFGDSDNTGIPAYWGVVNSSFGGRGTHSGSFKTYCAAVGFGGSTSSPTYQNSQSAFLSRTLVLTNLSTATLRFWHRIPSIEAGIDRAQVLMGTTLVWEARQPVGDWTEVVLSLVDFLDATNTLTFRFIADASVTKEGWYLDDIQVTDEYTASPPPANDNIASAKRIVGARGSVVAQNFEATAEAGEAGSPNSVWFKWRPWTNGVVTFTTVGSTFDTSLCVYNGTNVTALVGVACNDNDGANLTSLVSFNADRTIDYRISVSGTGGQKGKIRLNWDHPNAYGVVLLPDLKVLADPSKNFMYGWYIDTNTVPGHVLMRLSSATPNIGLGPVELRGTNTAPEVYQRVYHGDGSYEDRLAGTFTFHPTHNHLHFNDWLVYRIRSVLADDGVGPVVAFGTKMSFAVIDLDPYDSTLPEAPTVGNYKSGFTQGISPGWMDVYHAELPDQWIDITSVAPGRYWLECIVDPENRIQESDESNNMTRIFVDLYGTEGPRNDNFANATLVTGTIAGVVGDNVNATLETDEPQLFSEGIFPLSKSSIWYRWTSPRSAYTIISTDGSSFDTMMGIYTGNALSALTLVAKDDDSGDRLASRIRFLAQAGTEYKIVVAGYKDRTGRVEFNVSPDLNNMFADAITISNFSGTISGSTRVGEYAGPVGLETGEPVIAGVPGGRSQWFKWTPDHNGLVTFDTRGSAIDTLLGVYTGSAVAQLTLVASDNDSGGAGPSRLTFAATGGITYRIAIDGTNGVRGIYNLNWKSPATPSVVTQPGSTNVLEGSLVRLSVLADGADPLSYQWSHNDLPIVDDGNYLGSQGPTLVIGKTLLEHDGRYSVVITNLYGSITSAPAHIIVLDNPRAVYSVSTEGYIGGTVDVPLHALAVGDENFYQFTLAFDPLLLSNPRVSNGSGYPTAGLEFDETQLGLGRLGVIVRLLSGQTASPGNSEMAVVRLDISNSAPADGNSPVFFKDVPLAKRIVTADAQEVVAVYAAGEVTFRRPPQPPVMLVQPSGTNVISGSEVFLTASAGGDAPLTYQWNLGGVPLSDGNGIFGSTASSLHLSEVRSEQAGKYTVTVTNPSGTVTSAEANVVVLENPRFVQVENTNASIRGLASVPIWIASQGDEHSVSFSLRFDPLLLGNPQAILGVSVLGGQLTLDTTAASTGSIGLRVEAAADTAFLVGTQQIALLSFSVSSTAVDGGVSLLSVTNIPIAKGVSNRVNQPLLAAYHNGSITFVRAATPPPEILATPQGTNLVEGEDLFLTVSADGALPLGYNWFFNDQQLVNGGNVNGVAGPTLFISEVLPLHAGQYFVAVTNPYGGATSAPVAVAVLPNPRQLQVESSEAFIGGTASVSIFLNAQGNEHQVAGTILFDPVVLGASQVILGAGAPGATLTVDSSAAPSGKIGFEVVLPGNATFDAATRQIVVAQFDVAGSATPDQVTHLQLGSQPTPRLVLDLTPSRLATAYRSGDLTLRRLPIGPSIVTQPLGTNVVAGGDVILSVLATGDDTLLYQWLRNAVPLADRPGISGSAARLLQLSEVEGISAGDYSVLVSNGVGGVASVNAPVVIAENPRGVTVSTTQAFIGETATVPIRIAAQGDEHSVALSVRFNTTLLSHPRLSPGSGPEGANFELNTDSVSDGHIGLHVTLPGSDLLSSADQDVAVLLFDVSSGATDGRVTTLVATNTPVAREVRDLSTRLPAVFTSGTVTLQRRPIGASVAVDPTGTNVVEGGDLLLTVVAAGDPPVTYIWLFNGVPLSDGPKVTGSADSKLTIIDVSPASAGAYSVIVSNAYGFATSAAAAVAIVDNPRLVQLKSTDGFIGGTASVPILLNSLGDERSISLSMTWSPSVLGIPTVSLGSGAEGATLELNTDEEASGVLGVRVTRPAVSLFSAGVDEAVLVTFPIAAGATEGAIAGLEIQSTPFVREVSDLNGKRLAASFRNGGITLHRLPVGPSILSQPASLSELQGDEARFSVVVSGDLPLSFQWRKGGVPLADGGNRIGATSSSLLIREIGSADAGSYDVKISNTAGVAVSSGAVLTVMDNSRVVRLANADGVIGGLALVPLSIHAQGDENVLSATVNFDPAVIHQPAATLSDLLSGAVMEVDDSESAAGKLGLRVALPPGGVFAEGSNVVATVVFEVVASAADASVTQVTLGNVPTVRETRNLGLQKLPTVFQGGVVTLRRPTVPPSILIQPAGTNVLQGGQVMLFASLAGDPPLSFEWRRGNVLLIDGPGVSGSATASLVLSEVDGSASGSYELTVKNPYGQAVTTPAVVTVTANPRLVRLDSENAFIGEQASLPIFIQSQGDEHAIAFSVQFDPTLLSTPQLGPISGGVSLTLELNVDLAAQGILGIRATLPDGQVISTGDQKFGVLTFTVSASALDGAGTSLMVTHQPFAREVRDMASLPIPAVFQGGQIHFNRRPLPPTFSVQPSGTNVVQAGDVVLQTTATGDEPLSYQWFKNGIPLSEGGNVSGSLTSTLRLTEVTPGSAGSYGVLVTNPYGEASSDPALVVVVDNPRLLRIGSQDVFAGDTVEIPIPLSSQGDEHSIALSIAFDPGTLTYLHVSASPDTAGASITTTLDQVSLGLLGLRVELADGAHLAVGDRILAIVSFATDPSASDSALTPLSVGSNPVLRDIRAVDNSRLAALYQGGEITLHRKPLAPVIVSQPVGVNAFEGTDVSLKVVAESDLPMIYQWFKDGLPLSNGAGISGVDAATLLLGDVPLTAVGNYKVSVSNAAGSTPSDGVGVSVITNPRVLSVGLSDAADGGMVAVPIWIAAQGNESAFSFSLNFDAGSLTPLAATTTTVTDGASIAFFTSVGLPGKLGMSLSLPGVEGLPAGQQLIAWVYFLAADTATDPITISFGSSPTLRSLRDPAFHALPAVYTSGQMTFHKVQTRVTLSTGSDGLNRVTVLGLPGRTYTIEISPDLTGWSGAFTAQADMTGFLEWTEPSSSTPVAERFFRALLNP